MRTFLIAFALACQSTVSVMGAPAPLPQSVQMPEQTVPTVVLPGGNGQVVTGSGSLVSANTAAVPVSGSSGATTTTAATMSSQDAQYLIDEISRPLAFDTNATDATGVGNGNVVRDMTVPQGTTLITEVGNTVNASVTLPYGAPVMGDGVSEGNQVTGITAGHNTNLINNVGNTQQYAGSTGVPVSTNHIGGASVGDNSTITNNIGSTIQTDYHNLTEYSHNQIHNNTYQNITNQFLSGSAETKIVERVIEKQVPGASSTIIQTSGPTYDGGLGQATSDLFQKILTALSGVAGPVHSITIHFQPHSSAAVTAAGAVAGKGYGGETAAAVAQAAVGNATVQVNAPAESTPPTEGVAISYAESSAADALLSRPEVQGVTMTSAAILIALLL